MKNKSPITVSESNVFTIVEDVEILINLNGVYKQVPVYRRGAQLYAAARGGFVVLKERKTTSAKNIRWDSFVCMSNTPFSYKSGDIGWLEVEEELLKKLDAEQSARV